MIPHPQTVIVVRDMERRIELDRLARERTVVAESARRAGWNRRIELRPMRSLPPIALRVLARLSLAGPRPRQRV
jgi:hypothetical protein